MANRSKQKGDRTERAVVELLRSYGLDAYRIPLSGAVTGFKSDIEIRAPGGNLKLESKCRGKGFTRIYNWLEDNDAVVIKADREDPLVIIGLDLFASLVSGNAGKRAEKATDAPKPQEPSHSQLPKDLPVTNYTHPNDLTMPSDTALLNLPRYKPL